MALIVLDNQAHHTPYSGSSRSCKDFRTRTAASQKEALLVHVVSATSRVPLPLSREPVVLALCLEVNLLAVGVGPVTVTVEAAGVAGRVAGVSVCAATSGVAAGRR